ncbi:hypothetical protein [Rubritalea squalenifaciens]|nr:hypothetical protein [Rubritalea squalenifaciens]
MSYHAKLSDEALRALEAERRNSTMISVMMALLFCVLLGLVMAVIFLTTEVKETPEIITFAGSQDAEERVEKPEIVNQVERKPSAPSKTLSRVIASTSVTELAVPVTSVDLDTPSLDFGDSEDFGSGWGNGVGSGAGGGGFSSFGSTNPNSGLRGTFYDFKRDRSGKPTGLKKLDQGPYTKIIQAFTRGRTWKAPARYKHFTSPVELYTSSIVFKGIPDVEAGQAFQAPETKPGLWLVHYSGDVVAQTSGTHRLIGWGDNVLVIAIDGKIVLDASDKGFTGEKRTRRGSINVPGKPGAALYEGKPFSLSQGRSYKIDVLIGDMGGLFSAGAMVMRKSSDYKDGSGIPQLPALVVSPLTEEDRKHRSFVKPQYLNPEIFKLK